MKKKNSLQKAVKKARRELAVLHGAYDGRFAPKIIINKKKEHNKNACRNYRHFLFTTQTITIGNLPDSKSL